MFPEIDGEAFKSGFQNIDTTRTYYTLLQNIFDPFFVVRKIKIPRERIFVAEVDKTYGDPLINQVTRANHIMLPWVRPPADGDVW